MRRLPHIIAIASCLAIAWQIIVLLPQLPETIASHYGFDGTPTSFISRSVHAWLMPAIMAMMAVLFAGMGLLQRLPDRAISMPNRGYWLAPERRAQTLADVVLAVRWILAAAMAVVAGAGWFVIEANRTNPPRLPAGFLWMMLAYGAVVVAALIHLLRRFRRPKA